MSDQDGQAQQGQQPQGEQPPPAKPDQPTSQPGSDDWETQFTRAEQGRQEVTKKYQRMREQFAQLQSELEGKQTVENTLEQTQSRAANAERLVLAYQVAAAKGLPMTMAERLIGSNREELEADAESLREQIRTPAGPGHRNDANTSPPNGDGKQQYSKEQLLRIMASKE